MPPKASLDELEQERQRLSALMMAAGAELRGAKKRAKAEANVWSLSPFVRRVAMAMYALAGYEAEPVVTYLEARGREYGWPACAADVLKTFVEDSFLATDSSEIAGLADAASPADEAALVLAQKWVCDWKVVVWTRQANSTNGVAVGTPTMLLHAAQIREAVPEATRPPPLGCASEPRAKKWSAKLRKRWGGRYGKIPIAEHVDAAELRAKALRAHEFNLMLARRAHEPRLARGGLRGGVSGGAARHTHITVAAGGQSLRIQTYGLVEP
jgi:hypothetical protein